MSHLALVCSDMSETVDFYQGVLGMPLMMTHGAPMDDYDPAAGPDDTSNKGIQHFFFDCGNGDSLAFMWFPNGIPAAPGIANPADGAGTSADGSFHHLAFEIPRDGLEDVWKRLEEAAVPFYFVAHNIAEIDSWREDHGIPAPPPLASGQTALNDLITSGRSVHTLDDVDEDTYLASFYFHGPDNVQLELACWCEPAFTKIVDGRQERATKAHPRPATPAPVAS
ncbi:VOC family protein [Streptomyces sp. NPDC026672]|uniref:VOC family protein n=1 Tax=Streptomyces sp. NPDC026672 TaxID=3155252 RepID=UPI0033F08C2D